MAKGTKLVWERKLRTFPNPLYDHYSYTLAVGKTFVAFRSTDTRDNKWKLGGYRGNICEDIHEMETAAITEAIGDRQHFIREKERELRVLRELLAERKAKRA